MRRHVEIITCDRCKKEFKTQGEKTMELGTMFLENGSGSRSNSTDRDLNLDLCPDCTDQFKRFWGNR